MTDEELAAALRSGLTRIVHVTATDRLRLQAADRIEALKAEVDDLKRKPRLERRAATKNARRSAREAHERAASLAEALSITRAELAVEVANADQMAAFITASPHTNQCAATVFATGPRLACSCGADELLAAHRALRAPSTEAKG
jgi:hypothetical protein